MKNTTELDVLRLQVAEQSLARNKCTNRLEALAEQLGGLKKYVDKELNFTVYYVNETKEWLKETHIHTYIPGVVYMTKDCAIKICHMLNTNKFSLDEEL